MKVSGNKVFTTNEVAAYMGRHPKTIHRLARAYENPRLYPGVRGLKFRRTHDRGPYLFLISDVDRYLGL